MVFLAYRCETDAAIAKHGGCYAVPGGWREDRVPRGLTVVMSVHVDPSGCYQQAVRIDFPTAKPGFSAD